MPDRKYNNCLFYRSVRLDTIIMLLMIHIFNHLSRIVRIITVLLYFTFTYLYINLSRAERPLLPSNVPPGTCLDRRRKFGFFHYCFIPFHCYSFHSVSFNKLGNISKSFISIPLKLLANYKSRDADEDFLINVLKNRISDVCLLYDYLSRSLSLHLPSRSHFPPPVTFG